MEYELAVATAPPGWRHFTIGDLDRLPPSVKGREIARVPTDELRLLERGDLGAKERVLRALFWTLVYHLEPDRWDALASVEPIPPGLLSSLPQSVDVALDVGAGSGRLTGHLLAQCGHVVAVEPSEGLRSLLHRRWPRASVVAGWAEDLPLRDGCSQLTAACGSFGPYPAVLSELRRVTAPGGLIALINPESPDWFEANGWLRLTLPSAPAPAHEPWIDDYFGPPDPPRELVMTTATGGT